MQWFFTLDDDGVIQLQARLEEGGLIGHASDTVKPGGEFYGVPYDELHDARFGVVEVDEDGNGKLQEAEEQ